MCVALRVPPLVAYQRRLIAGVAAYIQEQAPETRWEVDYRPFGGFAASVSAGVSGVIRQHSDPIGGQSAPQMPAGVSAEVTVLGRWNAEAAGHPPVPHVGNDDCAIGALAADHLLRAGFRRFGWLEDRPGEPATLRREGFVERLADAGFGCSVVGWQQDLDEWLRGLAKPVGVMGFNDLAAQKVLASAARLGLDVPGDVAVIGVDDDPLFCAFSSPPLSSVVTGTRRIGYLAAELIDRMLSGEAAPEDPAPVPPVRVAVRRSTDVLAVEDPDVAAALRVIRGRACGAGGLQVAEVVREARVGRRQLELKFRKTLGHSPLAEIRRVRMEQAAELLVSTALSVGEVADRCGYSAQSRFGADFRATWAETPTAYRRRRQVSPQAGETHRID